MQQPIFIRNNLPKGSKLDLLLQSCTPNHSLQLHQLNDGAMSMVCYQCPFHIVLSLEEEVVVQKQLDEQDAMKE